MKRNQRKIGAAGTKPRKTSELLLVERLEDRTVPTVPGDLQIMQDQMRYDPTTGMSYEVYGPRIPWYFSELGNSPFENPTPRTPPLTNSFDGLDYNTTGYLDANNGFGAVPPDCTAAVGPNHVLAAVNSSIRWSDKSGGAARSKRLGRDIDGVIDNAFFDLPGTANDPFTGMFDPRVIYDQYSGRFVVLAGELRATIFGNPVNDSAVFIAVSQTSDPNGAWTMMRVNTKLNIGGIDTWLDYPALAIDSQAIYITGNFFSYDFQNNPGSRLIIIPKGIGTGGIYDPGGTSTATFYNAASLAGTSDTVMIPAHMFGTGPAGVGTFLVRYSGYNTGTIESVSIIRVNNPLSSPTFTHQFISSGDIDVVGPGIPDAGQLNGTGLDTGDRRALNAVWRNNNLYMVSTVLATSATPDVAQATAHWWRINTTTLSALTIADQGNISGNDIAADCPTFYGAIAVDSFGNMGFGFGASTYTIYAGFYYTVHLTTDAPGTVQASGTVMAGQDIYVRRYGGADNRWGDYFAAAIDPVDDSFWVYGEYAMTRGFTDQYGEQGIWGTRWGHFELPNAGLKVTNIGPVSPNPRNSAFDAIQVTFSQALNLSTFTAADLTLTRNGTVVSFSGNETFTLVSGTTYQIAGLTQETGTAGTYVLTINASTIQNSSNAAGAGLRSETWKVDTIGAVVNDVIDVAPDPTTLPVASIIVQFNELIDTATFTTADLVLTRDGNPVTFSGNETFTRVVTSPLAQYSISGLSEETGINGTYVLTVNGIGINDAAGNVSSGSANDTWQLQMIGQAVLDIIDVAPDPRAVAVPFVDVVFSGVINVATFTTADVSLTRNGSPVSFSGNETFTLLSGATYRIANLTEETSADGNYVITVNGAGILDSGGNPGTGSASDSWAMDLTGPTVTDVIDVPTDPRNTAVSFIDVLFSEVIDLSTFTAADVALTRNGSPVTFGGNETFALLGGTTYRVAGLSEETASAGSYVFTVSAAAIADGFGNLGAGSNSDSWIMDLTGPTVNDVVDVSPDPRNTAVSTIDVVFSEAINLATFTVTDVNLTRDGSPIGFSGNETFTLVAGSTYRVGGLTEETAATGSYAFTVNGAGISDAAGNAGSGSQADSWSTDVTAPTIVSVGPVTPNPRNSVVASVNVVFSEAINLTTLTVTDISLTRNGSPVSFSGNESFTLVSGSTYSIGGLADETAIDGAYILTVNAAGIQDLVGNTGSGSANTAWSADFTAPTVVDVIDIGPDPRNVAVASVDVVFSEAINLASFSGADIALTRTGTPVTFSGNETFTLVSGFTYRIGGLTEETNADGVYTITVQGAGIADLVGNAGTGAAADSFVIDVTPPAIVVVGPVTPDPRTTPIASVTVLMSEPIILTTFTAADISLTRDGSPVSLSGNETVTMVSGSTYSINGLTEETGTLGVYVLTVFANGIQDPLFNAGIGSASDSWSVTASGDATPPGIVNTFFTSGVWGTGFLSALGSANGFAAQTGAGQLTSMPWSTIDTIRIQFSENVIVDQNDLGIRGLNVANYSIVGFSYDSVNFVASWTLSAAFDTDRMILDLDGSSPTGVVDAAGNKLAGTWTEGVSNFPTSGAAGVNFKYRFVVAVGDADRNSQVRNADVNLVRANLFVDAGQAGYDVFRDIDANGLTRNADTNAVRSRLFVDPPSGPGPFRPGRSTGRRTLLTGQPATATKRGYQHAIGGVAAQANASSTLRRTSSALVVVILDELFASF